MEESKKKTLSEHLSKENKNLYKKFGVIRKISFMFLFIFLRRRITC